MPKNLFRSLMIAASFLGLQACGFIPIGNGSDATSGSRSDVGVPAPSGPSDVGRSSAGACASQLSASGTQFATLPDKYSAPGCNQVGTVQMSALAGDSSRFGISRIGPVKCEVAKAFSGWARFGVDRAARQILGSPLEQIETMGSYSCRNVAGTNRRSAHARAEAIDVSGFVLKDGRRISLINDWNGGTRAEREFLRIVHRSACKRFGTVLGPEYNAAHADHFHLEGTGGKFCR